jgi:hypothetical protein
MAIRSFEMWLVPTPVTPPIESVSFHYRCISRDNWLVQIDTPTTVEVVHIKRKPKIVITQPNL